jgi:tetratricopeptide (TPR) repeat protein
MKSTQIIRRRTALGCGFTRDRRRIGGVKYPVVQRVFLGLSLVISGAARGAEPAGTHDEVRAAVVGLASSDPAKRARAAKTLLVLGAEARRAVSEAARSDDPELRVQAANLLLKLPWYQPDDSPEVRKLLADYGKLDVDQRRATVGALAALDQHGYEALLRLIAEEPSDDVKWAIVRALRLDYRDKVLAAARKLDVTVESAPLLAAAGHAWMSADADRGARLLRQAMMLDLSHPANDGGEVAAAYDRLQNLALLAADYDRVAGLLRMRAARNETDEDGEPSQAVVELFAAHAAFGPLAGFDKDLETFRGRLGDPRVMFALGKVYERAGQAVLAAATYRAAFAVDLVSVQERIDQGDFLLRHGWLDLAEGQYRAIFDLAADHSNDPGRRRPDEMPPIPPDLDKANAHFRLAQVAAAREDDQFAADHMRRAMELHYGVGNATLRGSSDQAIWHEINWHALRAARKRGDAEAAGRLLATFQSASPVDNPDIANDVVPMLRAAGRDREAAELYAKVRQAVERKGAAEAPNHPMTKNNLAWLAGRSGEQKAEALRLAQEATRAMPDNAAFLDTLAEAHFQNGNYAEAARLEAKVVRARPEDRFLQEQLKRFQNAAATRPSRGH